MNPKIISVFSICLLSFLFAEVVASKYLVQLNHGGKLRGTTLKSSTGRPIHAFRGIPYAEPPTGARRFKAPISKAGWRGRILNAAADGPVCIQINQQKSIVGQEDCLYLNVYTPQLPDKHASKSKMAVMVYIHGGGFAFGESSSTHYGPGRLLESDVVLVSMNYRLGSLGFLSTGDKAASGNYGLMDQLLALQWVKKHIDVFGGDPYQVTIFGESAGAASVGYHVLSPLSTGLFHAAIAQSGSPLCPWALQKDPKYWAKKLATDLDCLSEDSALMVECLREIPALQLLETSANYAKGTVLPTVFLPSIDGAFLPMEPRKIITSGTANKVPYISGVNKDEGLVVYIGLYFSSNMSAVKQNSKEMLKVMLDDQRRADEASELAITKYLSNVDLSNEDATRRAVVKMFSDGMIIMGHYEMINLLSLHGFQTYAYSLDYVPSVSITSLLGIKEKWGVCHTDDLFFLFDGDKRTLKNPNENDQKVIQVFCSSWVNFAKYGDPNPIATEDGPVKWVHSVHDKIQVYHIDNPVTTSLYATDKDDFYNFWTEIVPDTIQRPVC